MARTVGWGKNLIMKALGIVTARVSSVILVAAGLVAGGCASTRHDTESMLSAAGFRAMTPTVQQQSSYAALPPYRLQRHDLTGKLFYAYKDPKAGVVYVGNEGNYQRYQQLAYQQRIVNQELAAAEMNQDAAMNWGLWGPPGEWH